MARGRSNVRGAAKRRGHGKPGCLSVFFLVVFVAAAIGSTIAIFFNINHIAVIGTQRYSAEQIRSSAEVEQGANLILLNKFEKTSNIFARLPYVDEVKMTRRLPDTLVIEIRECDAVAAFSDKDGFWLISDSGKVLEQVRTLEGEKLIQVKGPGLINPEVGKKAEIGGDKDSSEMQFEALVDTLKSITGQGIEGDVSELYIEKVYNVEFKYLDRFIVKLGMPEHLDYKIDCLKEVVGYLSTADTGIIDLSELIDKKPARFIPVEIEEEQEPAEDSTSSDPAAEEPAG
jgi:cell division protein FtsQ